MVLIEDKFYQEFFCRKLAQCFIAHNNINENGLFRFVSIDAALGVARGAGGGSCPRTPPEGGRQNLAEEFLLTLVSYKEFSLSLRSVSRSS